MTVEAAAENCLEICCPRERLPAVSDCLTELGCAAFDERPDGRVVAYAATDAELHQLRLALEARLGASVAFRIIALEGDWRLAFARSLEPLELTPTLWVEPRGANGTVPAQVRRLVLEPAFAFGYGEHSTTRLLARWLERTLAARRRASVLDFGCGTGVLALAALAFGARRVVGLDIDAEAIRAAEQNASLNDASAHCAFSDATLGSLDRDFDVVVANVDKETLVQAAPELVARASRHGVLALTGFLVETAAEVVGALGQCGVQAREIERAGDWSLVSNELERS